MNESLAQYWEKTLQYWNQFSKMQKWMIIGTSIFILLTLSLLIYHFSKTEYALAYTDLNPADAAAITEYLDNQGIPYQFSNDGTAIGVPSKDVTNVKIAVAGQNLVQNGSIGYGIFRENMSSFGMTENQFNLLKVDAQAGEIQQIINSINGVAGSKVILTLPEDSVFIREDENNQASASVLVQFKPNARVDQVTVDTIYNLVQKSVPNLPLENIAISNESGEEMVPSERLEGSPNSSDIVSTQFDIKERYEADIRSNVENFLGRIMGKDKVVVNVVSTLNFDQENRQERLFTPVNTVDQQGIERSVQEIQRSYTGATTNDAGGVPGTGEPDVPTYQGNDGTSSGSSEEMERIVNYEVNEITKSIVSSPYVVQDLTIFAGIEPPNAEDPTSLTNETLQEIKQMLVGIVSATLADSNKNFTADDLQNKVTVISRSFADNPDEIATSGGLPLWAFALVSAVVLLLGAGITYAIMRKRRLDEQEAAALELEAAANEKPAVPSIDIDNVNENQVRKQLEQLAQRKPEEFVNLLRTWLADE